MRDGVDDGPQKKRRLSADLVEVEEGRGGGDHLTDVEYTGHGELHLIVETELLEQGRRVVDQGVDTLELLKDHEHDSDHGPSKDARLEHVDPGGNFQLDLRRQTRLLSDVRMGHDDDFPVPEGFGSDGDPFGLYSRVCRRGPTKSDQSVQRLSIPTDLSQPSRRVGQLPKTKSEEDTRCHLDDKWYPETPVIWDMSSPVGLRSRFDHPRFCSEAD